MADNNVSAGQIPFHLLSSLWDDDDMVPAINPVKNPLFFPAGGIMIPRSSVECMGMVRKNIHKKMTITKLWHASCLLSNYPLVTTAYNTPVTKTGAILSFFQGAFFTSAGRRALLMFPRFPIGSFGCIRLTPFLCGKCGVFLFFPLDH